MDPLGEILRNAYRMSRHLAMPAFPASSRGVERNGIENRLKPFFYDRKHIKIK